MQRERSSYNSAIAAQAQLLQFRDRGVGAAPTAAITIALQAALLQFGDLGGNHLYRTTTRRVRTEPGIDACNPSRRNLAGD